MKKTIITLCISLWAVQTGFAQNKLFKTFPDSTALNKTGDAFIESFVNEIHGIDTSLHLKAPKAVYNLMGPFYYYDNNTMNLPVWSLSPQWYKDFCMEMAGSPEAGKEMFGLFFNGFYIPHELGHAIQFYLHQDTSWSNYLANAYNNEYEANIIALLYWKKHGKNKELKQCYDYAKKALTRLNNPVPDSVDRKKYFAEHYEELGKDIHKYAFFQWTQYVQVYEGKTLPDFDTYIKGMHK